MKLTDDMAKAFWARLNEPHATAQAVMDAVLAASDRPSDSAPIREMWGIWYDGSAGGKAGWMNGGGFPALLWPKEKAEALCLSAAYQPRLIYLVPASDRSSKDMVRHAEGGIYEHIGTAQPAGTATAGEHLEVYQGQDGRLWWRFQDDFADRFTPLDHPSHPAQKG